MPLALLANMEEKQGGRGGGASRPPIEGEGEEQEGETHHRPSIDGEEEEGVGRAASA